MTRLLNVTPFGAAFTLKRPTEKGRLLHMTIPMPRQLRVFDHLEDQYRIWAIVRHTRISVIDKRPMFVVGVAFIGKRPPASYEVEPWRRYDVSTTAFEELAAGQERIIPMPSADETDHTRHNIAVDIRLEILDGDGEVVETEHTVTETISTRDATIFTMLQIPEGRFIRLTSEQYRITAYAAIRERRTGADGVPRIHVEFIDKEWPL